MKKIALFGTLIIIIVSCQRTKKYEYVEIEIKESISGGVERNEKDGEIIIAKTDSIAYLEAYEKFCISKIATIKASKDIKEIYGNTTFVSEPINFKLLDEQGNDIALTIYFDKMDSLKMSIRSLIFD